ncbi:MAG: hypothetical protein Kow0089_07180 [Desulfobulbaceae bacterium]
MAILIEGLFAPECGARDDTMRLIRRTAARLSPDAEIREIEVATLDEARAYRFLGSPSIRVNGRDIEPGSETRLEYGLG